MAILTDTHLAQINSALAQIKEAENELALAKRAGLQTTIQGQSIPDLEAKITTLKAQLQQVKNVYFPNSV